MKKKGADYSILEAPLSFASIFKPLTWTKRAILGNFTNFGTNFPEAKKIGQLSLGEILGQLRKKSWLPNPRQLSLVFSNFATLIQNIKNPNSLKKCRK